MKDCFDFWGFDAATAFGWCYYGVQEWAGRIFGLVKRLSHPDVQTNNTSIFASRSNLHWTSYNADYLRLCSPKTTEVNWKREKLSGVYASGRNPAFRSAHHRADLGEELDYKLGIAVKELNRAEPLSLFAVFDGKFTRKARGANSRLSFLNWDSSARY